MALSAFSVGAVPPESVRPSGALPLAGGWSARFFVSPIDVAPGPLDEVVRGKASLGVNAQLSRRIARGTRLSIELSNAFDRQQPAVSGDLTPPAAGRGLRIEVRKTF